MKGSMWIVGDAGSFCYYPRGTVFLVLTEPIEARRWDEALTYIYGRGERRHADVKHIRKYCEEIK